METKTGSGEKSPRVAAALEHVDDERSMLAVGFDHLKCITPTRRELHLGMRFRNQPASGVDGGPFPARGWERSPYFLPLVHPMDLSGVVGAHNLLRVPEPPDIAPDAIESPDPLLLPGGQSTLDAERWRDVILSAKPVVAKWFVVHDTAGLGIPRSTPTGDNKGVHMFIAMNGALFLNRDFSLSGSATKFESRHPEFRGRMLHVELEHIEESPTPARPIDRFTDVQYRWAALAYVYASYRAGEWLTVTAHLEVDRGIPDGHSDPRAFDFNRFYRTISIMTGGDASSTYGILPDRLSPNANDRGWLNTFPAQYDAVTREPRVAAPKAKARRTKK